ncbi:MAG: hypothetical protein ACLTYN_14785 [Dysosmobacter welbionis]
MEVPLTVTQPDITQEYWPTGSLPTCWGRYQPGERLSTGSST